VTLLTHICRNCRMPYNRPTSFLCGLPRTGLRCSPRCHPVESFSGTMPIHAGGKVRQNGLSKKGDRYLRSLLVAGAMAVVQQAQIRPDKNPWVAKLLGRMSAKQAAIAIANKTARIAWAIMVHGGVYEAGHRAPQYRAEACAVAG